MRLRGHRCAGCGGSSKFRDVAIKGGRPLSNNCCNIFGCYGQAQAHHVLGCGQCVLPKPKLLADAPLDRIAQHRSFGVALADHQTELRTSGGSSLSCGRLPNIRICRPAIHPQIATALGARLQSPNEIVRLKYSGSTRKRGLRERGEHGSRSRCDDGCLGLGRENRAAFGAARCDHATTAFGGHAGTKAVVAFAADNGRLECTFHDLFDSV